MVYEKTIYFNSDDYIEEYVSRIKIDNLKEKERERLLKSNKLYTEITANNLSYDEMLKLILKDFKFIEMCKINIFREDSNYLYIKIAINLYDDMTFKDLKYIVDYFNEDLVIPHGEEEVFLFDGYYD